MWYRLVWKFILVIEVVELFVIENVCSWEIFFVFCCRFYKIKISEECGI